MLLPLLAVSGLSLILATGVFALLRVNRAPVLQAFFVLLWACFALVFLIIPVILLENVVLLVFLVAALRAKARVRTYFGSGALAITLVVVVVGILETNAWRGYAEKYPLESLSDRLVYERSRPLAKTADAAPAKPVDRLDNLYQRQMGWSSERRRESLRYVHQSYVRQFIDSPGFGAIRMMVGPSRFTLDNSEENSKRGPIAILDEKSQTPVSTAAQEQVSAPGAAPQPNRRDSLENIHDSLQVTFANPVGFGYVQDIDHVAGFQPHGFRDPLVGEVRTLIARIELVSLLKHPTPMVYLSADLPNMRQLATAPVRPLDAFEERNLQKLVDGGDLEVEEFPERTRMLGSIRAASQCVQCHAVQRGALLGAFSYELSPARTHRDEAREPRPASSKAPS